MIFVWITNDFYFHKIKSFYKDTGIDRLSEHFSWDGAKFLSKPISEICNFSISHGVFPDACKVAKLKPIHKNGKKTDPSNYRPNSLLPIISKVIETIVHDQSNNFSQRIKFCIIHNLDLGQIIQQICVLHISSLCLLFFMKFLFFTKW